MGIYDKQKSISRRELKKTLGTSRRIPGTFGRKYTRKQAEGMEENVFGSKYGSDISKSDYRRAVKGLESTRRKTKDIVQKRKINRKIEYLKKLGGKKI